MQIVLAHRIELHPNRQQEQFLRQCVGVARFAYNWALEQWQKQYQAHQQDPNQPKPNEAALRRQFNKVKRE